MEFVHLHVHTHYSMQSSPVFPGELFSACRRLGMESVAVTDYCSIFNMPELFSDARKAGVKLIIGSEVYLLESGAHSHAKNSVSPSLLLLVESEIGYRNLCILLSRASRDGFINGMPHLESRLLEEYSGGLICLSAYSSGRIGRGCLPVPHMRPKRLPATTGKFSGRTSISNCSVMPRRSTTDSTWPP